MDYANKRDEFISWTKNQLIGFDLKDDILNQRPLDRFHTGFLFPANSDFESISIEDSEDEQDFIGSNGTHQTDGKAPKKVKRYLPPSSVGFSFYIEGDHIEIRVYYDACNYSGDKKIQYGRIESWKKNRFKSGGEETIYSIREGKIGKKTQSVFEGRGEIQFESRKHQAGFIVTVSISNTQKLNHGDDATKRVEDENLKTLFEVELKCFIENGQICKYPMQDKALLSKEEKEVELRYKDVNINAVGHGVAVNWDKNINPTEIYTEFMPIVEVPHIEARVDNSDILQFDFLRNDENKKQIIEGLTDFVNKYEKWISEEQAIIAQGEDEEDSEIANEMIQHQKTAKTRMQHGIKILGNDKNCFDAFTLANQAMLMQMEKTDELENTIRIKREYKWRPFQLAFILLALESTKNKDSEFRETLDLIWFPTGGGKTEAYLGLLAFLFIYRRLNYTESGGGTVAIMRYTLRLLTTQPYERATKVIFALDLIRRKQTDKLGEEPFSIGLWIGGSSCPNTTRIANELVAKENYANFIMAKCPWCGEKFGPNNYISSQAEFNFKCCNQSCDFGGSKNPILPCNVVDDELYNNPPTLLLATVDKFARLAWEERTSAFFGKDGNQPPDMIIQDELHLITGALGSIFGLYEVGIDTAMILKGSRVKYIASTATIRNAKKQVKTLFARETAIFPPPGIRYNDSYFAREIPIDEKPGKMYVGYLAPNKTKQNCLSPLAGAISSAPIALFYDQDEYFDAWWTQVVYHGSLKGVGVSLTQYESEIRENIERLTVEILKLEIEKEYPGFIESYGQPLQNRDDFKKIKNNEVIRSLVDKIAYHRNHLEIKSLTSRTNATSNANTFEALGNGKNNYNGSEIIDAVLATNMISVGLDVNRLAIMIINGQPLTTAEYVQSSGRVGRKDVPGIVFVNYYKMQARSVSHYENFISYHKSFHRFVEPSSVTPFTFRARQRALHASLVIAVRHGLFDYNKNDTAGDFASGNDKIKKVIITLFRRCSHAIDDNTVKDNLQNHINKLVRDWEAKASKNGKMRYENNPNSRNYDKSYEKLLYDFNGEGNDKKWRTLHSLRNVDKSSLIQREDNGL